MFHLVYTSYSTAPFSEEELIQLLNQSRVSNKKLDITGMLVYLDNKFIQVLEGERTAVVKLYEKIAGDPRHKKVALLLGKEIPASESSKTGRWASRKLPIMNLKN